MRQLEWCPGCPVKSFPQGERPVMFGAAQNGWVEAALAAWLTCDCTVPSATEVSPVALFVQGFVLT